MRLLKSKQFLSFLPILAILVISCGFFYKTILFGKIPFAGDLLLTSYAPWRHVSYFGYVAGAIPSKDQYFDVVRELYPWKTEVIRQISEHTSPLWNPYSFSGSPLLANYQSQVFYPLGILYLILPQVLALTILIILQPILGGIFMYLFAGAIGMSTGGAIIAAIAFNFSSFANVWMEFNTVWHTVLWLPLLLFIIEKGIANKRLFLGQQALFMFGLFSSITGGHPQDFINTFLFFSLYTCIRVLAKRDWSHIEKLTFILNPLSLIIVIPFLLAAPQLLPTIELFRNSARVPHDYQQTVNTMLFQPSQLVLIAVQEFFGNPATKTNFLSDTYVGKAISIGVVGFFLSLFSIKLWKRSWHVTFFIVAVIGLLLYTVNTPVAALLYRYPIPILSTGSPTRVLFLFCFSLSILAGFGFDELRKAKTLPWKPIITMAVIMLILWAIALLHPLLPGISYTAEAFRIMRKSMLIATGFTLGAFFFIYMGIRKRILSYGIIGLVILELLYGFLKFNPFVPSTFVFPDNPLMTFLQKNTGIDRIWGYGTAQIEANFSTQYRIFSPDGTDPLNLKWYNEFIQSSRDGNIAQKFNRTTRSDAQIAPGYGARDLPDNPYRLRIMDALGIKYVIDRTENPKDNTTFAADRFKEIWHQEDWTVYENLRSARRFFLTSSIAAYRTQEEFEKSFFSPLFDPNIAILLSEKDVQTLPKLSNNLGVATLISYKPNSVLFETETDGPQLLYLSDTYDYGWKATVDSKETPVYRANYAFRAALVPGGTHKVEFSYQPVSFTYGIRAAFFGLFILILLIIRHSFSSVQNSNQPKKKN